MVRKRATQTPYCPVYLLTPPYVNPRRMAHGIPRAGDGPAGSQTPFIPDALAQLRGVCRHLAGVAVAVERVAGTAAQQERQQHLPPEVAGVIGAHILAAVIRQRVEPAVQPREAMADDPAQVPSERFALGSRVRLSARRTAVWRRMMARFCVVTLRTSCLSRLNSFAHS